MNMEWYEIAVPTTVAEAPLTFAWEGPDKHIGPVERETPLLVQLKNKTTNGTTALAAATATWGFLRFAHHLELAPYLKFAEAVFLQMPVSEMIDVYSVKGEPVPNKPPAVSAIKRLRRLLMSAVNPARWGDTIDQPFRETFHIVHLVRHVLDRQSHREFDDWFDTAVARIDQIAARPPEQDRDWEAASEAEISDYIRLFRGQPIAPLIFAKALAADQLAGEYRAFATPERLAANPFIRPDRHPITT